MDNKTRAVRVGIILKEECDLTEAVMDFVEDDVPLMNASPALTLTIIFMHCFRMEPRRAGKLLMKLADHEPIVVECRMREAGEFVSQLNGNKLSALFDAELLH